MGIFDVAKPNVSKEAFYKIVADLIHHAFTQEERQHVVDVFEQALDLRAGSSERGIDEGEIEDGIARLTKRGKLTPSKIQIVREMLLRQLRTRSSLFG